MNQASHSAIVPRVSMLGIATLALSVILATTATAAAGSSDDDYTDRPFQKPRTEMGVGLLVGGYSVGPIHGAAVGLHTELGRQMGPLSIFAEYNMLSMGESSVDNDDPVRGMLHRFGLNARYHFTEIGGGRRVPIQGAFWMEAGIGRQIVHWNEGGRLTRNDIGFGFGAQTNFRVGKRDKPQFLSIHYGFKAFIAASPDSDPNAPVTCGGPCDEATAPSPNDLGLMFNMGFEFGK